MGSELKDLKKDLYVKYLDTQRSAIYQSILVCNGELVRKLYRKKRTADLSECPLWLFHGGELINLYSTDKNKVPTKDIDLKLYMTGSYSIDPKVYKKGVQKLKISLSAYDFYDSAQCKKLLTSDLKRFKGILQKESSGPRKTAYDVWRIGEEQKIRLCSDLVVNGLKGSYSQMNLKTGQLTDGLEMKDLEKCRSQISLTGDRCKAFIVNVPYVTQVGRDNYPYDINDREIYKMGSDYDEDMDGYPIDEDFLAKFNDKLQKYREDPRLQTVSEKISHCQNALMAIRSKNQKFKLSTVVGVTLVYNETRDEWYMFQEGILDAYIDYGAGHHTDYEKRYLGRYADGSFPTILRRVGSGKSGSVMKFPTLAWMIYDQLRMLFVTLKDSYPACDETKCVWKKLGGGAAGNSEKYFKKLLGLLNSFETTIKHLQDGNNLQMKQAFKGCKGFDLEKCGPQAFLGSLFQGLEADLFQTAQTPRKSTRKTLKHQANTRKAKRKNARKTQRDKTRIKTSKRTKHTSFLENLTKKNNAFDIY